MKAAMNFSKLFASLLSVSIFIISATAFADESLSPEVQALLIKARAGDVRAQFSVGSAYDWGRGAPRDGAQVKKWYLLAAEGGLAEAQNSLGSVLEAEKSYSEAFHWYQQAAAQGLALATNNLGQLYDTGRGVTQDRQKAFELYSKAGDQGDPLAMWNIATLYGSGALGEKDMMSACIWTLRSRRFASSNDRKLQARLVGRIEIVKNSISREQFASCERQGDAWAPHISPPSVDAQPGVPADLRHNAGESR